MDVASLSGQSSGFDAGRRSGLASRLGTEFWERTGALIHERNFDLALRALLAPALVKYSRDTPKRARARVEGRPGCFGGVEKYRDRRTADDKLRERGTRMRKMI